MPTITPASSRWVNLADNGCRNWSSVKPAPIAFASWSMRLCNSLSSLIGGLRLGCSGRCPTTHPREARPVVAQALDAECRDRLQCDCIVLKHRNQGGARFRSGRIAGQLESSISTLVSDDARTSMPARSPAMPEQSIMTAVPIASASVAMTGMPHTLPPVTSRASNALAPPMP